MSWVSPLNSKDKAGGTGLGAQLVSKLEEEGECPEQQVPRFPFRVASSALWDLGWMHTLHTSRGFRRTRQTPRLRV
jgi:hypothetical protein